MAKFQACKFLRTEPKEQLKRDIKWENGIAKVEYFGDKSVEFIIDEAGNKLSYDEVWDWRVINGVAYCAIDTETGW